MEKAGGSSDAWQKVCSDLSHTALKNYRDVAALREKAEARRAECLAAEQEQARRQAKAKATKKKLQMIIGIAATAAVIALILLLTKVIIPKTRYNSALELRANGHWEEAVEAFAKLGEYSDAEAQVPATYYAQGETLRNAGDWDGAVAAFTSAGDYSDAETQITEIRYLHALSCMNTGDYKQAYQQFVQSKGYKDVDTLLANDENLLAAAAAARDEMFTVGNYVTFGTYPQTKAGNDETPIEWLVIDRDGDHALLLSRYGLDAQPYHTSYTSITWENCTLRTWLNKDFINRAFTEAEQAAILLTNVDNSRSQCYSSWSTSGGSDTQDKVFLLSYAEANKYLSVTYNDSNRQARVAPNAYAVAQNAYTSSSNKTADGEAAGWWWLRSPGYIQSSAAVVYTDGSLGGNYVDYGRGSVRPALWVDITNIP